jgi:hypothetical protein
MLNTFAARQTVQARAPRTTGVLALEPRIRGGGREIVCERTSTRSWSPFVDPYIYKALKDVGPVFNRLLTVIKKRKIFLKKC